MPKSAVQSVALLFAGSLMVASATESQPLEQGFLLCPAAGPEVAREIGRISERTGCTLKVPHRFTDRAAVIETCPGLDWDSGPCDFFSGPIAEYWVENHDAATRFAALAWNETYEPAVPSPDDHEIEEPGTRFPDSRSRDQLPEPERPRFHRGGLPVPGFNETSEFMMGSVAVGVFLMESTGSAYNWTSSEISRTLNGLYAGMEWWRNRGGAAADLSFVYDLHLQLSTPYEPIQMDHADEYTWIGPAMASLGYSSVQEYNNHLRATQGTDWAFSIFFVDSSRSVNQGQFPDGGYAWAYIGGPWVSMSRFSSWAYNSQDYYRAVPAHELGHIFGATDEYDNSQALSGYLHTTDNDGANCLMNRNNLRLCNFSPVQVGWRDTDFDGIHDILDTDPSTSLTSQGGAVSSPSLTYQGNALVTPFPNQNPGPGQRDVTLNTIDAVQFRIDGGPWQEAVASDGAFDGAGEGYSFEVTLPGTGTFLIESRAINSVGNRDETPASDLVTLNPSHPLSVQVEGEGTVTSTPEGIDCGADCSETYTAGTVVTLSPEPAPGWAFTAWTGHSDCLDGSVVMDQAKTCQAAFATTQALTVFVQGEGEGRVTSLPAGLDCGSGGCGARFLTGTVVELIATPSPGSVFGGWSGHADCADGSVTLTDTVVCRATFDEAVDCDSAIEVLILNSTHNPPYFEGFFNTNQWSHYQAVLAADPAHRFNVAVTPQSVLEAATLAARDVLVLPDNAVAEADMAMVEAWFQDGKTLVAINNAASYAAFSGLLWPSAAGTNGFGTVWFHDGGLNDQEVQAQEVATSGYSLGQRLPSRSQGAAFETASLPADAHSLTGAFGDETRRYSVYRDVPGRGRIIALGPFVMLGDEELHTLVRDLVGSRKDLSCPRSTLAVTTLGEGSGTIHSNPAGILCGPDCSEDVPAGQSMVLSPTADPGSSFEGWSGHPDCLDGVIDGGEIKTCTARFELSEFTLTAHVVGHGDGRLISDPAGIDCGSDCSERFPAGTSVTLQPVAMPGSSFNGWSGHEDCFDGVVLVDADKACYATFIPTSYTLFVSIFGERGGEGRVRSLPAGIDCGDDCTEIYPEHTVVDLLATPAPGSVFMGWRSQADCLDGTVTMNDTTSCSSRFAPSPVLISEIHGGTVDSAELHNPTSDPIDLEGWILSATGCAETTFVLPSFQLEPGASVAILEGSGAADGRTIYLDGELCWHGGEGGSLTLAQGTRAMDFVRFGDSTVLPPSTTLWQGASPTLPDAGLSLGRSLSRLDSDNGSDWCDQTPSPGAINAGCSGTIFEDGFESGSTLGWALTDP